MANSSDKSVRSEAIRVSLLLPGVGIPADEDLRGERVDLKHLKLRGIATPVTSLHRAACETSRLLRKYLGMVRKGKRLTTGRAPYIERPKWTHGYRPCCFRQGKSQKRSLQMNWQNCSRTRLSPGRVRPFPTLWMRTACSGRSRIRSPNSVDVRVQPFSANSRPQLATLLQKSDITP